MDNKKVLVITYYWPPSGGAGVQRWVKFCKYLPSFNIEPIVLTVEDGTYPLIDETLVEQVPEKLKIYRARSFEPYSLFASITGKSVKEISTPATAFSTKNESLLKKLGVWVRANVFIPDARVGWVAPSFEKAQQIILDHDIDTVITTGPPNSTHIIGTRLKEWKAGLKWIMDMRDPWSKIFFNQTLPRTNFATKKDIKLEQKALSLADEVIVVSDSMASLENGIYPRMYHVIPNGFDHEDFSQKESFKGNSDKMTVKYIGSMTEPAIPYNFFNALKQAPDPIRNKINVQFFGSVNEKARSFISEMNLMDIVHFNGYVPHIQAKNEMRTADLLLLVIPNTEDNELILTGKLFDYIGAQKPIIYIGPEDGDAATIIKKFKLGTCFGYNEIDPIIELFSNMLSNENTDYKKWDSDFQDHPFSRYSLTRTLSEIIQ